MGRAALIRENLAAIGLPTAAMAIGAVGSLTQVPNILATENRTRISPMKSFYFRLVAVHVAGRAREEMPRIGLADDIDAFALYAVECNAAGHVIQAPLEGAHIANRLIHKNGAPIDWNLLDDATAALYEKIEEVGLGPMDLVFEERDLVASNAPAFFSAVKCVERDMDEYMPAPGNLTKDEHSRQNDLQAALDEAWRDATRMAVIGFTKAVEDHDGEAAVPILDTDMAWRDYQRAQAPVIIPTLPLFANTAAFEPAVEEAPAPAL